MVIGPSEKVLKPCRVADTLYWLGGSAGNRYTPESLVTAVYLAPLLTSTTVNSHPRDDAAGLVVNDTADLTLKGLGGNNGSNERNQSEQPQRY